LTKQHAVARIQLNIVACPIRLHRNSYETMLLHCFYYFPLLSSLCVYCNKKQAV